MAKAHFFLAFTSDVTGEKHSQLLIVFNEEWTRLKSKVFSLERFLTKFSVSSSSPKTWVIYCGLGG